jgi:F0F1-type ATP synthase assembly protein I
MVGAKRTMHTFDSRDWRNPVTSPRNDRKSIERTYLRYAGSGVEFFAMIAVMTLLGAWLDARLGTAPALTIVLALVGFVGATWILIRSVSEPSKLPQKRDEPR